MEQPSTHSLVRIQCPKCKTRYRIDRSKIPPQGATIRCKKCDTKLLLRRKPEKRPEIPGQCPKCGFHQKQGEFCYKCGTRIRQHRPKSLLSEASSPSVQIPVGLIEFKIEYKPALFFLSMLKPIIEIDGELYPRSWGNHQFQVPPGKYHLKVYGYFLGHRSGQKSQLVNVEKDDYIQMQYTGISWNQAIFRVAKKESNAPWRSLIKRSPVSKKDPWYYKPIPVIFSLVTIFPLGAYLLWKSRQFSDSHKLIIAVVGLVAFIWILINLT
ncbi:zinc-ribbon domain-containing protein [bacterium]|nr:zinc-ribbon domain-containing protein [bacterium]